jgi:hypothetical protein
MICPKCNSFEPGFLGRLCPVCSEPLIVETSDNRDRLVLGRLKEFISKWQANGQISNKTAHEIEVAIEKTNLTPNEESEIHSHSMLSLFLNWFQVLLTGFFAGLSTLFEPMIVRPESVKHRIKQSGQTDGSSFEDSTDIIFDGSGNLSGLDALSQLDKDKGKKRKIKDTDKPTEFEIWSGLRPLFNEYIWWFIGSLLVLTGSIMGIREAWMVLNEMSRHITVLGALFLYQALFVGLGVFLGSRSVITGRLLSGISILLLPVLFSVASDVILLDSFIGYITLIIISFLSAGLLSIISKQYELETLALIIPILPSVIIQSLIPFLGPSLFSVLLTFLPLIAVSSMAKSVEQQRATGGKGLLFLSMYGAFAVIIIFINQTLVGGVTFSMGSLPMAVFLLWLLSISYILSTAFGALNILSETTKIFGVLEILFLAIVLVIASGSGLFIYATIPAKFAYSLTRLLYLIMPVLATSIFFKTINRYVAAIHPFMALSIFTSFIITGELIPLTDWSYAMASIIPISGLLISQKKIIKMEKTILVWGILSGLAACSILIIRSSFVVITPITGLLSSPERLLTATSLPTLVAGLLFAFAVHKKGGWTRSFLHCIAAYGTLTILQASVILFLPPGDPISNAGIILSALSILYTIAGIGFERTLGNEEDDSIFKPLDDISILSAILAFICIMLNSGRSVTFDNSIILGTGMTLLYRSFKDKSSFVSLLGSLLFSVAIFRLSLNYFQTLSTATNAFVSALIALTSGVMTIFIPNLSNPVEKARKIFYVIRLPFPAQGLVLIRDALSATSILYVIYTIGLIFTWLGLFGQPERNLVIYSGVSLSIVFLIAFFTRGFAAFYLRGSTVSLSLIFFCIGLAAVANRIGRPLPPTVVGFNLTLGIIALWIFSRVLFHFGNKLALWLENPSQGKFYHHVPLASMGLLGLVLFIDALLMGPSNLSRFLYITPPTFFVGAGLAALLYGRSLYSHKSINLALGLFIIALAIGFAQQSFLGIPLVALDPPGGRWVPAITEAASRYGNWLDPTFFLPMGITPGMLVMRAATGIAVAGTFYALCVLLLPLSMFGKAIRQLIFEIEDLLKLESIFSLWSFLCTLLLALIAYRYAFVSAGVISLIGGAILLYAGYSREGLICIALNGLFIIHGLAHSTGIYPLWAGPVLAGLGLFMVLAVKPLSSISGKPYSRILESSHTGALIYSIAGFVYSLATASIAIADNAVPGLLTGMGFGLGGLWMQNHALGLTTGICALSLFAGSLQWTKILSTIGAASGMLLLAFSAVTAFPASCVFGICVASNSWQTFPEMLPYFALLVSLVNSIAYFTSEIIEDNRKDFAQGSSFASDALIITTGIILGLFIRAGIISNLNFANIALVTAIGIIIIISLLASYKTRASRHLYFAQTSIASFYLALKPSFPGLLTPEIDSIAALIFGFILIGVTSVARNAGIPPLAESTRRFAALMPIIAALALPTEASYQNAGMATFSAVLYAGLAIASSNRIYAVLSAIAANLAIFTAIMASNVQGIEIYLAPLGLFSLFLGQIFKDNLSDQARKIIRLGGGLLLYLPAAVNISFEMGRATDAMYAVIFGMICLIGIGAGMIFQIRSYLFMGVSFFTLNIVANLLQKGLRDQRIGFILLSLTGLMIIGCLVYYTMKKDKVIAILNKMRMNMENWD